jgi:hypothetical protein
MAALPHFEHLLVIEAGGILTVTFMDKALCNEQALATTREELALLASMRPGANVILDIGKDSVSSPVLALLIGLHRRLYNGGGALRLRGLPPAFDDLWPGMGA